MTSAQPITPRVHAEYLPTYVGHNVLLVGEVISFEGGRLVLRAADGGEVTVIANEACEYNKFVEILGTVQTDHSVHQLSYTNYATQTFDLEAYNMFLAQQYENHEIFIA